MTVMARSRDAHYVTCSEEHVTMPGTQQELKHGHPLPRAPPPPTLSSLHFALSRPFGPGLRGLGHLEWERLSS